MLAVERFAGVLRNLQARSADLQGVSPYNQLQPEGRSINLFTLYASPPYTPTSLAAPLPFKSFPK